MKKDLERQAIIARLGSDPFAAADLYRQSGDRDIGEPLVRALEDADPVVRRAAVEALVALNDLYAASAIYWTSRRGSDPARLAAVEVLLRLPEPFSIPYLVDALLDPLAAVRVLAGKALIRIDRSIPKFDEHEEDIIQSLLPLLEHKDKPVREAAADVLMAVHRPIATLYLGDILIHGSPDAVRASARILKAVHPPRSLWALLPDLFLGEATKRKAAMAEAARFDPSLVGRYLRSLLGDNDAAVRQAAADQLAKISPPSRGKTRRGKTRP